MTENSVLSAGRKAAQRRGSKRISPAAGIFVVLLPFVIVALIGDRLGDDTDLASSIIISLAYVLAIVVATFVLKGQGSGWREIGLARPDSLLRTILMAAGAVIAAIAASLALQIVLMNIPGLALGPSDQSQYNPLQGNLPLLIVMIVASWTSVAFGEEMLFRAYLTYALASVFQGMRAKWALALFVSSLLFGLAHYDWGLAGVIDTTLMGLVFGSIYLRAGRNLWIAILAHSLINTLKFAAIYAGAA